MHTRVKQTIIDLARATPEVEVCGLIYADDKGPRVYPCANVAADPAAAFELSQDDHLACLKLGDVIGVYHSHPHGPAHFYQGAAADPTQWTDIDIAEEAAIPFYLYDLQSGTWAEHIPASYTVQMEGRRFIWGFDDCYGTARHWYRQKLGLNLRDYDRDETFSETDSTAIMDNFAHEGFVRMDPATTAIKLHDALLFDLTTRCPQHLAIFTAPQRMLHHPLNSLSHIDLIDGRWVSHLKHVLRHETQL